jgi:carotenoid 1,2-hydratase
VFSPYYAFGRRFGGGDPAHYCAVNVALYGAAGNRWCMTERPRTDLLRSSSGLAIGSSSLDWKDGKLSIAIDERCAPLPRRLKGVITLEAGTPSGDTAVLDGRGAHLWRPVAPHARIKVTLEQPLQTWSGSAYFDQNWGSEPLEKAFERWTWARAHAGRQTYVIYDADRRDGTRISIARVFGEAGEQTDFEPPAERALPPSIGWRMQRTMRSDESFPARLVKTFENTPFYARSLVQAAVGGDRLAWIHESLSLDRVSNLAVRMMLPFRMPRAKSRRRPDPARAARVSPP